MTEYIHYGSESFDPDLFFNIKNSLWGTKPMEGTGLWASRNNDSFGWEAWCKGNHYSVHSLHQCFRFHISADSNVLTLEEPEQLIGIPKLEPWKPKDLSWINTIKPGMMPSEEQLMELYSANPCRIDFEELISSGIDAVELTNCIAFKDSLQTWDCNCILIMNPHIILPI